MTARGLMRRDHLRRAVLGVVVALAVVANGVGLVTIVIDHARPFDWDNWVEAARRFPLGTLYDWSHPYAYHYAPQLAPVFGALTWIGIGAWRVLHLAVLPFMPSRWLGALLLVSYPFWADVDNGNLMVFIVFAAAWAVRGSRVASIAFIAMAFLMPRPIMLPLLAWLLWRRPNLRWPAVALAAAVLVTALPTGYLGDWLSSFAGSAAKDVANTLNLSPSRFIGYWWLLIGLPAAAWLTVRGRLGWASLAVSPYLLPYWIQMLGLELVEAPEHAARGATASAR